nr:hypothetical protein L203_06369 [Cryptococcus depauperatus CBS 7841]
MAMDAASLSDNPPRLGKGAYGPGISVLVDTQSTTGSAVKVVGGVCVGGGEAFRARDIGLVVFVEFELGDVVGGKGGGGDEGGGRSERKPGAQCSGDFLA